MMLTPRGWTDFQHYKDRAPPWIRLHRKLLDNFDFHCMPVASRALAPMLWLLASEEVDGKICKTLDEIAFRLRMKADDLAEALNPLILAGFFEVDEDASSVLAARLRSAEPETETETEVEAETEASQRQVATASHGEAAAPRKLRASEPPTAATWEAYATAYRERYGADPVRNATVNAQLRAVVARLGGEEAPHVAAFYVRHNAAFYVRSGHATGGLLKDCEKLRTEWATRRQITATAAQQADRTQTNLDAFAPLLAKAREEAQQQTIGAQERAN